jgi:Terpene cyclase DEP1
MISLMIHAALGLLTVVLFLYYNGYLYRTGWKGSGVSWVEALYYLIALCAVTAGWYFNIHYVQEYPAQAGWVHFTKMLFTNPAAGSVSQDLIAANVFLLPLWTIIDGPRRGLKGCWLYFVMSLFTSFAFAMGLYLAAQERQVRWLKSQG